MSPYFLGDSQKINKYLKIAEKLQKIFDYVLNFGYFYPSYELFVMI